MVEGAKKPKKVKFSEEDAATLLKRYSATTVLSLLQEVAQVQDEKMDWTELVKKTKTGITNAREYQMLWRNLAYSHAFVERLDGEAESAECLDDDSDIESELTAMPSVSSDTSMEAAACVKVLITSGSQSESSLANGLTVEAPLFINVPYHQSSGAPTDSKLQRKNIAIPVTVPKITNSSKVACAEGLDANGAAGKKKRKPWSEEEDLELISAVQKFGEGNWANIVKGDLKSGRTASQLSQRWQIIRKKQNPMRSTPQVSEAMVATRRALHVAFDMPDALTVARPNACTSKVLAPSNPTRAAAVEPPSAAPHQSQPDHSAPMSSLKTPMVGKKQPMKTAVNENDLVKATAVAAGARIASPSDVASLHAAQAKNAVHIMSGGASLNNSLPPNVHFLRNFHPATSRSTQQVQNNSSKSVRAVPPETHRSAESTTAVSPGSASETKVKAGNTGSSNPPKEQVKDDQVGVPSKNVPEGECGGTDTVPEVEMALVSGSAQDEQVREQGETTDPAQEGQTASSETTTLKPQNQSDGSSQEAAIGDGGNGDIVMTDAQVEAEEEPK